MKIAIVDDEKFYRELEKECILERNSRDHIQVFTSAHELLENGEDFDVVFLDVEMPEENGIQFAREQVMKYPCVVFVTGHSELVYDAFGRNVVGFIVKEKLKEQLLPKLREIEEERQKEEHIQLYTDGGYLDLPMCRIQYFYSEYECVYAVAQRIFRVHEKSLKSVIKTLPRYFFRVNRNTVVNLRNILNIYKNEHTIEMQNGEIIKVSERKWKEFKLRYLESMMKHG